MSYYVGIDIGGSGSRLAVAAADGTVRYARQGPGISVSDEGVDVLGIVATLLAVAEPELADVAGIGVGCSGVASLVAQPGELAKAIRDLAVAGNKSAPVALAVDAATAVLGALAGQAGCVTALGTGAISVGWDGQARWHRVDGWGHLLGDRGGGAWIGLAALGAAMEAADGVSAGGGELLQAATKRLGPPPTWPQQLYPRPDKAAVLASIVPEVAELAAAGDPRSQQILSLAGTQAAHSALAVQRAGFAPRFAVTGQVAAIPLLKQSFSDTILGALGEAEITPAHGSPLDGSLRLARLAAAGEIAATPGFIWVA